MRLNWTLSLTTMIINILIIRRDMWQLAVVGPVLSKAKHNCCISSLLNTHTRVYHSALAKNSDSSIYPVMYIPHSYFVISVIAPVSRCPGDTFHETETHLAVTDFIRTTVGKFRNPKSQWSNKHLHLSILFRCKFSFFLARISGFWA